MVEEIRAAMGGGERHGVRLRYAVEVEPLGTAGGVRNAADLLGGLVVVLNGDVLTDADLGAMLRFHADRRSAATIYLTRVPDPRAYGLVELGEGGRVLRFIEKPDPAQITTDTINAGAYILERRLLDRIPERRPVSIEREFFPGLLADRIPFFGWVGDHYWLDIGSPAKYRQGTLELLAGNVRTPLLPAGGAHRLIGEGVTGNTEVSALSPVVIGAGCRLGIECAVGPWTVLGDNCGVGRAAVVQGAVLWERVDVGVGARLRDCIVGAGARIGDHADVGPGTVVESGAEIPGRARLGESE